MLAIVISCIVLIVILLCYINNGGGLSSSLGSLVPSSKGGVNNPGFLVVSNAGWEGAQFPNSSFKFENFDTLEHGIRAWYINLYSKVRDGRIKNTNDMIDILTPKGKENSEIARNNYKASVAQATNWLELGRCVFDFESNSDWKRCTNKTQVLQTGLQLAYNYIKGKYHLSGIPQYTLKP